MKHKITVVLILSDDDRRLEDVMDFTFDGHLTEEEARAAVIADLTLDAEEPPPTLDGWQLEVRHHFVDMAVPADVRELAQELVDNYDPDLIAYDNGQALLKWMDETTQDQPTTTTEG